MPASKAPKIRQSGQTLSQTTTADMLHISCWQLAVPVTMQADAITLQTPSAQYKPHTSSQKRTHASDHYQASNIHATLAATAA